MITAWLLAPGRPLGANTGAATRRAPLTRACICSNCLAVMPTAREWQRRLGKSRDEGRRDGVQSAKILFEKDSDCRLERPTILAIWKSTPAQAGR